MVTVLRENQLSGWRRHVKIPGNPDFTWQKERVVLFVDGCFWHGHYCNRNLTPKTNTGFWKEKIQRNAVRDRAVTRKLRKLGWHVVRVWECELKSPESVVRRLRRVLHDERSD